MVSKERAEYKRRWQKENKDKVAVARKKYLETNRELLAARTKAWREKNVERMPEFRRKWHKQAFYKMTLDDFEKMLSAQDGKCSICGHQHNPNLPVSGPLHVDHDHRTGIVRGLLCGNCNTAIGLLQEDITIMKSAISYIEKLQGVV